MVDSGQATIIIMLARVLTARVVLHKQDIHTMTQGKGISKNSTYDKLLLFRNGYYSHGPNQPVSGDPGGGGGSWHEPVSGAGARSESPGAGGAYPGQPPAMYSCKMAGPPSPQETKVSGD